MTRLHPDIAAQERMCGPALKQLSRMERRVLSRRLRYEGSTLNLPRRGDVLMHFTGASGQRVSIRIDAGGGLSRIRGPFMTAEEFAIAAE